MDVGIGLPNAVPGTSGAQLIEWARRAEARGFSSLGTIDRIAYDNYEPLIALAAAAAVTERIGLCTSVLLGPLRENAVELAKQALSVHALSGGRLTLGIGLGGRDDDYEISGLETEGRGKRPRRDAGADAGGLGGRRGRAEARGRAAPGHRRRRRRLLRPRRPLRRGLDRRRPAAGPVRRSGREGEGGLVGGRPRGRAAPDGPRLLRARRQRRGGRRRLPDRLLRLARRGDRRLHRRQRRQGRRDRAAYLAAFDRAPAATS